MSDSQGEGSQEILTLTPEEEQNKTVPLTKYIGVKEMLGKREASLTEAQTKLGQATTQVTEQTAVVKNLETQLEQAKQSAVDPEQTKALTKERDDATTELATMKQELLLKEHGIKPEEVENMNAEQVQAYIKGKGQGKPAPDLGGGAGAGIVGSGRDLIRSGFDSLHPSGK